MITVPIWLASIAILLRFHWPVSHPLAWDWVVWLYVLSGPLSPLYHLSTRLLWAYRSRRLHPAPQPAQRLSDSSISPWRDDTAKHIKDGTYYIHAATGRRFEVQWVRSSWCWWHGEVRAVDGVPTTNHMGGEPWLVREFLSITVKDMHDGVFLSYTPPELAPILNRAGVS